MEMNPPWQTATKVIVKKMTEEQRLRVANKKLADEVHRLQMPQASAKGGSGSSSGNGNSSSQYYKSHQRQNLSSHDGSGDHTGSANLIPTNADDMFSCLHAFTCIVSTDGGRSRGSGGNPPPLLPFHNTYIPFVVLCTIKVRVSFVLKKGCKLNNKNGWYI